MSNTKTVTMLYTTDVYCECPHCNNKVEGWFGDPSGATDVECEFCMQTFNIHQEADIEYG